MGLIAVGTQLITKTVINHGFSIMMLNHMHVITLTTFFRNRKPMLSSRTNRPDFQFAPDM
jgi:hypothetical protein